MSRTGIVLSAIAVSLIVGVILVVKNLVDQSGRHVNTIKEMRVKYAKSRSIHKKKSILQIRSDLERLPNRIDANYTELDLTKEALRLIEKMRSLEKLDISNSNFKNEDLLQLQHLRLNNLQLRETPLSDAGLQSNRSYIMAI